jgi:hypothetical protein
MNVKKQCAFVKTRGQMFVVLMIVAIFAALAVVTVAQEAKKAEEVKKAEKAKHGPLLMLLIKKGVVTEEEYSAADAKFEPKPLPKGSPVDSLGGPLTYLLIEKGIFTQDELLAEIKDEIANKTKPNMPVSNLLMKKGKISEEERNAVAKGLGIELPAMPTAAGEKATTPTMEKKPAPPKAP